MSMLYPDPCVLYRFNFYVSSAKHGLHIGIMSVNIRHVTQCVTRPGMCYKGLHNILHMKVSGLILNSGF